VGRIPFNSREKEDNMSRTHIQQSQISGSLVVDINESASLVQAPGSLVGDLNILRTQIKGILGEDHFYSARSGQDLKLIYAAMHASGADADFQGSISTVSSASVGNFLVVQTGGMQVTGSADLSDTLHVAGNASFDGNVTLGDAAGDTLTFNAKAASELDMDSHKVVGLAQASAAGDALAWGYDASVSDLVVTAGDFTVDASGNTVVGGTLGVDGVADFSADVYAAAALYVSGASTFAAAADFNGGITADQIKIDGDVAGHLYFVDPSTGEIQDSDDLYYKAGGLYVTGSAEISNGLSVLAGGLTVGGDRLEVTGSLAISGVADFGGKVYIASDLGVSGSLTVANDIKISGDVPQHLYLVGASGEIQDETKLWFDGSKLYVTGSAELSSNLEVKGGSVTLSNGVSMASSAANKLVITATDVVEISHDLKVDNNLEAVSGSFTGDVTVSGDLYVQGAMTYIETENLKVKDAIIHLATGSNAAASRGIVLHGGSGSGGDIAVGAKINGYDFVFAKNVNDADVDAGNSEIFSTADLAGAWLNNIQLGVAEGALSGSLAVDGSNVKLSAEADLKLSAHGDTVSLMTDADYQAVFGVGAWAAGETLVGALETLYQGASGGAKKGNLSSSNITGDTLDFSSVGVLGTSNQKFVDVYLNGVLLAYGVDVNNLAGTGDKIDLDHGLVTGLTSDDVITVILRGAA